MSNSSTPIVLRLQDLKSWQGHYDSRISVSDNTNNSDYDTIEGLSCLDTTNSATSSPERFHCNWDNRQVNASPSKPFNVILEEKLAMEAKLSPKIREIAPNTPKRPFLRKGSGLNRFRVKQNQATAKKYKAKSKTSPKASPKVTVNATPLKMPTGAIKPKATWVKVVDEKEETKGKRRSSDRYATNPFHEDMPDDFSNTSSTRSSSPSSSEPQSPSPILNGSVTSHGDQIRYEKALEKELNIFETLEERVTHSSFCSTDSSVLRLLSSTPSKSHVTSQPKITMIPEVPAEVKGTANSMNLHQQLTQLHRKEFFSSVRNKLRGLSDLGLSRKSRSRHTSDETQEHTVTHYTNTHFSDEEKWSSHSTSRTHSPSNSEDSETLHNITDKVDAAVNTSFADASVQWSCDECRQARIKLDEKNRQVAELEKRNDQLIREMHSHDRVHSEEMDELRELLVEERKKLSKERMVYQTYSKDAQTRTTKKEREQLAQLRKELADVQELMKLKDSKNGATQARLRNQIKQYEKENGDLKLGNQKLTKENAKLTAKQKLNRRPSETKMLQEMNKNLSKLTAETLKKESVVATKENQKKKKSPDKKQSNPTATKAPSRISRDSYGLDMTQFANVSVEKQYESVFGQLVEAVRSPVGNASMNESKKERTETMLPDGSKEVRYSNGNIKTISPTGNLVVVKYYNGDIKQNNLKDKISKYYYGSTSTWHTQFADGIELIEFPNGQSERKFPDGKCEICFADGAKQVINPDGTEVATYPDGSVLHVNGKGNRILHLPNGQTEIHTNEEKRREYPDGTVKILYPDGAQETRYPNGRVRMKNSGGKLIMDTEKNILS